MMTYRQGDLLDSKAQTLVNTVNCRGVMGKGVALAFKRRFPQMYKDYVKRCKAREVRPGDPYLFATDGRQIINFPTKDDWRRSSRLEYVENGLLALRERMSSWHVRSLALPALGCGNGGLDWADVRALIERYLSDVDIDIEVYEPIHAGGSSRLLVSREQAAGSVTSEPAAIIEQPLPFITPESLSTRNDRIANNNRVIEQLHLMVSVAGTVDKIEPMTGNGRNDFCKIHLDDNSVIAVRGSGTPFVNELRLGDHLQVSFAPRCKRVRGASYYECLVVRVHDGQTLNAIGSPGSKVQIVQ